VETGAQSGAKNGDLLTGSRRAPLAAILQVNQQRHNDADKRHESENQQNAGLGIDIEVHESSRILASSGAADGCRIQSETQGKRLLS
jgi:hypothetical protein